MFIGMGSGMLAQGPLAVFVENYGWRSSLFMLGAFGFLLAASIFILVRNAPASATITARQKSRQAAIINRIKTGRRYAGGMEDSPDSGNHVRAYAGAGRIMGHTLYDERLSAQPSRSGVSGFPVAVGMGVWCACRWLAF